MAVVAFAGCAPGTSATAGPDPADAAPTVELPFDPGGYADLTAALTGSGSSFQEKYLHAAADALDNVLVGLDITYAGGGSGQGKSDLVDGLVAFAGTDSPLDDEALGRIDGDVLYFPTVVAPITVSYHLDGVEELDLDAPTVAGIFTTTITRWDDEAIVATNPGVDLPAGPITVCRRADSSGTTTNFSTWLDAAGGDTWNLGVGDSLAWPPGTRGVAGNGGVSQCIRSNPGAIGYVDLADAVAQDLTPARIANRAGVFVAPTLAAATAAAEAAPVDDDLLHDPIDTDGADAYPITAPTWVAVRDDIADPVTARAVRAFVEFLLTDGRDPTFTASISYAPVPDELAARALGRLDRIGAP